METMIMDHPQG